MSEVRRKFIYIGLIVALMYSCKTAITNSLSDKGGGREYAIVKSEYILENDTISVTELRYYKIYSALDGMKMMYVNFQQWDERVPSKYQDNINQIVWKDVPLFQDNRTFTVIADGTETEKSYFASLIVLDARGRNCLNKNYPMQNEVLDRILEKMRNLKDDQKHYHLFNVH